MTASEPYITVRNTSSREEYAVFVLLSIPLDFDKDLGEKLLAEFINEPPSALEKVLAHDQVVFCDEENSWHFDNDFRVFLLNKIEEYLFNLKTIFMIVLFRFIDF